jgi:hypothetical protein
MLTDLLTRPCGTRETQRATRDGLKPNALVSGTHLPDRDERDARHFAHNPATFRARFVPEQAAIGSIQRSLTDNAADGLAGPEQLGRLPETTS